jgi:thymidylate synthase ThyX
MSAGFVQRVGRAAVVHGLPEELIAMVFGKFSRSELTIEEAIDNVIKNTDVELAAPSTVTTEGARKFHERITIGYGHKSVGDHAQLHLALNDVSMLVERSFTSARLIAATSKSSRYVDFSTAGYVVPNFPYRAAEDRYRQHCKTLIEDYERITDMVHEELQHIVPFKDSGFKTSVGWDNALQKRALDVGRNFLPCATKTSFALTASATGIREILDKRHDDRLAEIRSISTELRSVARLVAPTLIPDTFRATPRSGYAEVTTPSWALSSAVQLVSAHDGMAELSSTAEDSVQRWGNSLGKFHLPPDRSAEMYDFVIRLTMPFAIHREFGRHRMMTQLASWPEFYSGYGVDPIHELFSPEFQTVYRDRMVKAFERMNGMTTEIEPYAAPLGTMVNVVWKVNLRQLTHILSLRSTPQAHPECRRICWMIADTLGQRDERLIPYFNLFVNRAEIIVGRPET